ncbi:hypothetical protein B0H34DRAFT_658337, partial [Crassisporium funariophilum]
KSDILFQLRTGHAPLAKHLHRIGKVDTPRCPCCGTRQLQSVKCDGKSGHNRFGSKLSHRLSLTLIAAR